LIVVVSQKLAVHSVFVVSMDETPDGRVVIVDTMASKSMLLLVGVFRSVGFEDAVIPIPKTEVDEGNSGMIVKPSTTSVLVISPIATVIEPTMMSDGSNIMVVASNNP
jgi:hypothetical protein